MALRINWTFRVTKREWGAKDNPDGLCYARLRNCRLFKRMSNKTAVPPRAFIGWEVGDLWRHWEVRIKKMSLYDAAASQTVMKRRYRNVMKYFFVQCVFFNRFGWPFFKDKLRKSFLLYCRTFFLCSFFCLISDSKKILIKNVKIKHFIEFFFFLALWNCYGCVLCSLHILLQSPK